MMASEQAAPHGRTIVIGAGIIGMMTAYSLAKRGHAVTVIDRLPGPAELCSHANAGIVAVGHAKAWAEPAAIRAIARALAGRDPSVRITQLWDPALWRWGLDFLRNCSPAAYRTNTAKLQRLSRFSRDLLATVEAEMNLPAETRHEGGLYLFQNAAQFDAYCASLDRHQDPVELLDRDELVKREQGLQRMAERLVGGLFSGTDSVGNCRLFTVRCRDYLAAAGQVEFMFDTAVTGLLQRDVRIEAVETDHGPVPGERVVLATGVETPDITRPLGFSPLIYPVKGYSGTWQIIDPTGVPRLPFIDETEFLAVGTYDGLLRVTATAEFAGHDRRLPEERTERLGNYVRHAFGSAVDLENPVYWTGLRPTTPAGPPYLGRIRHFENLWINAGHGQLGWTMSLGCGEILAQRITGEPTSLENVSAQARWLEE
jgi:D-amino-acid dehydrogenase